jgi:hypothetical protein
MAPKALAGAGISVLLQGTLRLDQAGIAHNAIKSVRNVLPNAEIVISHPEKEDPRGLEGDKFVSYADPGPDICFCGKSEMNLSRQIVSMKTGLEAIDRPFVLKFRPEFLLSGNGFVSGDSLGKIRVTNAFTHNLNKDLRYMHVSDVIQFGELGRMLDFWSTDFSKEMIWECDPGQIATPTAFGSGCSILRPEQFLTLEYAKRNSTLDFSSLSAMNTSYSLYLKNHSFITSYFEVIAMTESQIDGPNRFAVVSTHSRFDTSWQDKNPNFVRWLGSLIFWFMSSEGALTTIRAGIRKTFPALEAGLSRNLSSIRKAKARLKNL